MYEYLADVVRVLDGDTLSVSVDVGFRVKIETPLRMYGINAPEIHSANPQEKDAGLKAKAFLETTLAGKRVIVRTFKPTADAGLDKYGRYLANVYLVDRTNLGQCVNDLMVSTGHAKPYHGEKREPWTP